MRFEVSRAIFWSLFGYRELKLTLKLFTGRTLCSLLTQIQNISFWSSGMCRKQQFWDTVKVTQLSWLFLFPFSPLHFSFLMIFFCWAFSRLHFGGKGFWERFWDLRIRWNKRWLDSGTRFSWKFSGHYVPLKSCLHNLSRLEKKAKTMMYPWLNCANSGMVWKVFSLCTS